MLTNSQILLHLIDRYLHGYTSTDLLYTRMKQQLYKLIQSKLAKESICSYYLGAFRNTHRIIFKVFLEGNYTYAHES